MPLVYACICPHGTQAIKELADARARKSFAGVRTGIEHLADDMNRSRPDTIIVASPHNLRLWKHIAIITSEHSSGQLANQSNQLKLSADCDVKLAWQLLNRCLLKRLPVVGANYGTFEGESSDISMDWGVFVPLWFFLKRSRSQKSRRTRILIVTPSREIKTETNIAFGRMIANVSIQERNKRIAFVASADQSHVHSSSGPYGLNKKAAEKYDKLVIKAIGSNSLEDTLLSMPRSLIEDAKADSFWQMAILAGIQQQIEMRSNIYSYNVPSYFGMISASFFPVQASQS